MGLKIQIMTNKMNVGGMNRWIEKRDQRQENENKMNAK